MPTLHASASQESQGKQQLAQHCSSVRHQLCIKRLQFAMCTYALVGLYSDTARVYKCSTALCMCRFAAVRTLNKVAMTHPMAVTNCNIDMESLISDQNRSIATLAITTLLKTGNESSVDRLLKQVCPILMDPLFAG